MINYFTFCLFSEFHSNMYHFHGLGIINNQSLTLTLT